MTGREYYELGKWLGDRRGYPRVGIVNTNKTLINDTRKFLEKFGMPITLNTITKTERPSMFGEKSYEVFIVDSRLHKNFEQKLEAEINLSLEKEKCIDLLAGLIDADGTIDRKNEQVVISIIKNNLQVKKYVEILMSNLSWKTEVWDCQKEWKISIKLNEELINLLKNKLKHPAKIRLLKGKLSPSDTKYLNFVLSNKIVSARLLSSNFDIHIDSARRLLRCYERLGYLNKIKDHNHFIYSPKINC